ncbi:MAG: hypothetical protein ACLUOI_20240 [Eisenbergiella sp.]
MLVGYSVVVIVFSGSELEEVENVVDGKSDAACSIYGRKWYGG